MTLSSALKFCLVAFSLSLSQAASADPLLSASYDADSDSIQIRYSNHCREVYIDVDKSCTRSFPGQTMIQVIETMTEIKQCTREMFKTVSVPASSLACLPAALTVRDADVIIELEVPSAAK